MSAASLCKEAIAILTKMVYIMAMGDISFTVRIPQELADWLAADAQHNQRSRNRHIAHILQTIKTQSEMRHNMRDERWQQIQARKFPESERVG
jgi:hypothetical protein